MVLTSEDQQIMYQAVRDGSFTGSLYGTIVFHFLFFGGLFLLYLYFSKKYGNTIKSYGEIVAKLIGVHK